MGFKKAARREIEVAFSKAAQPVWFRIVKYIVLGAIVYLFWGQAILWVIFLILFVVSMTLHFWYRYKTQAWTRSYGMWDYEKNRSRLKD